MFHDFLHAERYKRNQGRMARRVTMWVMIAIWAIAAYRVFAFWNSFPDFWLRILDASLWRYMIPTMVAALGCWISFRIVNIPSFADFLIAVEAEMNKVSWPSRKELIRSSAVVIIVIGFLVVVLFAFDFMVQLVFSGWLKIIRA